MGVLRKLVVAVVLLVVVIAAAFVTGLLGTPSAGLEDHGDWGNVTENRTEIITTVWVDNPNPVGIKVSDSVEVSYQLTLNDVQLATGGKSGISVPSGNNTVPVSTYLHNEDIAPWWVSFVNDNETIPVRAESTAKLDGMVSATADLPTYETTLLTNSTPVITALSEVASGTEGEYTETLSGDELEDRLGSSVGDDLVSDGSLTDTESEVTVGYEIREGWAEWGEVDENTTTVYFHFRVHNPGDVPVPASPENVGINVDMNGVEMFSGQANDTTLVNADEFAVDDSLGGRVLEPGETQNAVYAVEMDNDKIDDWFRSHVTNGEQTDIRTEMKLVFSIGDVEFAVPAENPIAYTCELQTAILVDDQATETNCGEIDSLELADDAATDD